MTVQAARHVSVAGAHNFRDIGGYPTADGSTMRRGRVYRSRQSSSAPLNRMRCLRLSTARSGKDRTGFVIALLLALAGVEPADIALDYAATAEHLAGAVMVDLRTRSEAAGIDWESYQPLLQCPPQYMLETLDYLQDRYGGAAEYLVGAGFDRSAVEALRWSLLE